MKTLKLMAVALLAATGIAHSASAQVSSTNAPATVPSFFASAEQYLTSFNTNYTFQGVTFELATGYKQVTGVGAASVLDGQYDIGKFHLDASFQFSGVGSAVNAEEGGVGYDLIQYYDTVLEADILGGYDENLHSGEFEPKVDIKKKMTPNTFTEIGISMPIYLKERFNNTPSFYFEAGFTY